MILFELGALIKKVAKDSSPQTGDRIEVIFLILAASFGSLFRTFLKGAILCNQYSDDKAELPFRLIV